MKAKNWIYGLGFLVLLGGGVPLPVSAAENAQVVTRGGHKHHHKPIRREKRIAGSGKYRPIMRRCTTERSVIIITTDFITVLVTGDIMRDSAHSSE